MGDRRAALGLVAGLAEAEGVAVLAGGAGFGPTGRYAELLGADAWDSDPGSAARRLDDWLHEAPVRRPLDPPDDEQLLLEASRPGLVEGGLHRLTSQSPIAIDAVAVSDALDMAVAAIESASLVGGSELLLACAPMLERALPPGLSEAFPVHRMLEGFLPELRKRSPRAAAIVETTLPAVIGRHASG